MNKTFVRSKKKKEKVAKISSSTTVSSTTRSLPRDDFFRWVKNLWYNSSHTNPPTCVIVQSLCFQLSSDCHQLAPPCVVSYYNVIHDTKWQMFCLRVFLSWHCLVPWTQFSVLLDCYRKTCPLCHVIWQILTFSNHRDVIGMTVMKVIHQMRINRLLHQSCHILCNLCRLNNVIMVCIVKHLPMSCVMRPMSIYSSSNINSVAHKFFDLICRPQTACHWPQHGWQRPILSYHLSSFLKFMNGFCRNVASSATFSVDTPFFTFLFHWFKLNYARLCKQMVIANTRSVCKTVKSWPLKR